MPLYNHAAYIAEAIESILSQGESLHEVIVVDDGSGDKSAAIMRKIAAKEPLIHFQVQTNHGAHATLNTAIGRSTGDFLAILNSDDFWLPGRLDALLGALERDRTADIALSGVGFMDAHGADIDNAWYHQALAVYHAGGDMGVALLNGNFAVTTSNLLFRRQVFGQVGAFAALRYAHDLDWLLRALALGRQITVVDTQLLRYRVHVGNTISENPVAVRADWAIAAAAYLTLLWDRPGAQPINWDHAAAAAAVLRKHELDRAVSVCMAYLRRFSISGLDTHGLLADAAFVDQLRNWV